MSSAGRAMESIYAEIVARMPFGVAIWRLEDDDRTLRLVGSNPAASQMLGVDLALAAGKTMTELFPLAVERERIHAEVARTGKDRNLGYVGFKGQDDVLRTASARALGLPGRLVAIMFEDVTGQAQSEARRRESEERFRTLIENSTDAVTITDHEGSVIFTSASVKQVLGYSSEELQQRTAFDLLHEDDVARARTHRATAISRPGVPVTTTLRARHRDGHWHVIEVITVNRLDDPSLRGVVTNFRDVTERVRSEEALRRMEAQLLQTQKMEAIGKLAGGVAHDFNNLLSVILGISALLLEQLEPDHPMRADMTEIQQSGERAARLTRQLLAFSRRQMLDPRVLDLNDVIASIDRMLLRVVGEDIELQLLTGPHLHRVRVDPGQMEQVIMNLVVNARDAMPRGGALTLQTASVELDEAFAREHIGVTPGPHVMLAITDTGVGMDEETQARIYEPFFTTKATGKGTGLGLATVFGIVKQSGGTIWLESVPDRGTTFRIYFPATAEGLQPSRPASVVPASRGNETILLVEDDTTVRAVVRAILSSRGYDVIDGGDAAQALTMCRDTKKTIHLLLTDVVMPRMSGRELAVRVAEMRPGIRVLYMSGYAEDNIVHHGVVEEGIAFLQKPITPTALTHKVREVLDS
jgi:two-component system cell cycle sensor histidine kinase/response regulator CckA